jgi:hypothetical protein
MTKKPEREWPPPTDKFVEPPYVPNVHKPGDKVTPGPLYQFRQAARDDGKPYKSAEPRAERQLLGLLGTNAVTVVMCGLLAVVVVAVLVLLVVKR